MVEVDPSPPPVPSFPGRDMRISEIPELAVRETPTHLSGICDLTDARTRRGLRQFGLRQFGRAAVVWTYRLQSQHAHC